MTEQNDNLESLEEQDNLQNNNSSTYNTEPEKTQTQHQRNMFDSLMFGPRVSRHNQHNDQNIQNKQDEEQSFDLFNTAQTMMDTYKQLSPYVKGASNMVKKFKK
ncbi:hypothetical protein [Aquibacillus saliphilus]|uniref:hypothetical protein n=1 Tax=Aquibacillus saliphilus TaxID=1909422 RepID=UPI001CEFB227|nr:hypothetical protein [Aquibacillus saliphilus]